MSNVLPFRLPLKPAICDSDALDLMSAVDFAIRDLVDLARHLTLDSAREQADACRQMLQDAYDAALEMG